LPAHERAPGSHQGTQQVPRLADQLSPSGLDRDSLNALPCGCLLLTRNGEVLFANRALGQMLALDPSSAPLEGRHFSEILTRGSAIFYETHFMPSLLLRGSLEEIAFDFLCGDRSRHPVLINASLRGQDILLAVFGAKQRHLYEAELLRARRESEQVAEIVRKSSDAIIRFSADGLIESWNAGAQQIFGYSIDDCKGRRFDCLFAPEALDEVKTAMANLQRGDDSVLDTKGLRASGEQVDVSLSLTPHMEAPGVLVAFSAIIRDITARKRAELALIQNEKLASVGRLASSIAHEINNPLEAVTNLLYILSSGPLSPQQKQFVDMAQEELARVSHITTHTLRFHKQSSRRTEVAIRLTVESILGLYRARLANAGVETIVECDSQLTLTCYEGELRQILVNLISNAFDGMRGGGRLRIRAHQTASAEKPQVHILISDAGTGMSPDILARVFEPFFSTKGIGGTGLGLWITKDLVHKNHGTIRVRSSTTPERGGTTIMLSFTNKHAAQ
jgi:PAS domain S-box-containing protein